MAAGPYPIPSLRTLRGGGAVWDPTWDEVGKIVTQGLRADGVEAPDVHVQRQDYEEETRVRFSAWHPYLKRRVAVERSFGGTTMIAPVLTELRRDLLDACWLLEWS